MLAAITTKHTLYNNIQRDIEIFCDELTTACP